MLRLLAHEGAETRAAEMERLRLFVGAGVSGITRVLRETLGAESLAGAGDPGNESSSGAHPASQDDSSA